MYRHVFWDLGGTLVDTSPQLDADVVRQHDHEVDTSEVTRLTRHSTGFAIATLSERYDIPQTAFIRANEQLKTRWASAPAPVMTGARELMTAVAAAGGLNLVVTHRDRVSATSLIEGLGLPVDDLVSTSDGYPRKPDPAMYRVLMLRHGLDASECLAVGDRPIDAEAAQAAGITAVMLETPGAPVDDPAQHEIHSLAELRALLHLG